MILPVTSLRFAWTKLCRSRYIGRTKIHPQFLGNMLISLHITHLILKWYSYCFCCRKEWSMLSDWETMAAGQLMGMVVWPQCNALMVFPSPSAPAAWVAMGLIRPEDKFLKFSTTGKHNTSLPYVSALKHQFSLTGVVLMAEGVSMTGTSSLSCSAKPMRRTRTAAEHFLSSVLWSELQRTCFTGHLLLMVSTVNLYFLY